MLSIVVVDKSASARNQLVAQLHRYLQSGSSELDLLPRISVKPLSLQELRFHEAPDICVVGSELIINELTEVGKIRAQLPHTPLVAQIVEQVSGIATIEQLARMGVTDTIGRDTSAQEFFRKLVLLAQKSEAKRSSKLIVIDSGKGGVGVTSLVASLGEKLLQIGKKVAIVDFDFETQDLSRFLQSKPFVNDPLQLMLEQSRPITEEFVAQALSPVWNDEQQLLCMSPAPEAEELYAANSSYSRSFLSIFQVLDGGFDAVVVDSGSARGSLLRTLYRIADTVVFAINNDPATLYASADRLSKARAWMSVGADLVILENASMKSGLSQRILRHEFSRAVQLDDEQWLSEAVPFCPRAARWPGSGATMVTLGRPQVSKAFDQLVERLGFQSQRERNAKIKLFKRIKKPAIEHHDGRTEEDNGNNKNVIYLIDQNRGSQDSQEPALSADDLSEVVQEVVLSEQQLNTNDFSMDLDEVVSEVAFESDQRAKTVRGSLA